MTTAVPSRYWEWLVVLGLVGLFVVGECWYMSIQSLWTDELTQLHGIRLPFVDQMLWLAHQGDTGSVPYDRTPPLSYILGSLWGWLFGMTTMAQRALSLSITASALLAFWYSCRCRLGTGAAFFALCIMASSPNILAMGTEIRAYPLFLFLSVLAMHFSLKVSIDRKDIAILPLGCVLGLAILTHFYGVVLSLAVLVSMLWVRRHSLFSVRRWAELLVPIAIAIGSILPILLASTSDSPSGSVRETNILVAMGRLCYKLVAHAAFNIYPAIFVIFLSAIVLVLLLAAVSKNSPPRSFKWALALPLGIGLVLVFGASVLATKFDASSSSYNLWMIPFLIMLVGSSLRETITARVAAATATLCSITSGLFYLYYGAYFIHGPYEWYARTVGALPADTTAVIYDADSNQSGMAAIALDALQEMKYSQYQLDRTTLQASLFPLVRGVNATQRFAECTTYVVVSANAVSAKELTREIRNGSDVQALGPFAEKLSKDDQWILADDHTAPGWTRITVRVFTKL